MLTALPASVTPFASSQHGYSPGTMEKPVAVAATVGATPQLVPMAVPPPHFLIGGPGQGYTILPSVAPINSGEAFGGLASLRPLGQFTGHGQPVTALPYYDVYQQQRVNPQSQSPGPVHRMSAGTGGGVGRSPEGGTTSAQTPPESKPDLGHSIPPPPLVPVTSTASAGNTPSPSTPSFSQANSGGARPSPMNLSNQLDQPMNEEDPHGIKVKRETTEEESLQSCTRSNSDSRVDEAGTSTGGGVKGSYQISALIDVPTSLTRSSRTSSLSSSLSSFRFGGSLNTLWASQLPHPGAKIHNMKSTG